MANAALIYPFQAPLQQEPLIRKVFPFLSLPAEIRSIIYEYAIFPDNTAEFFILNPMLDVSLLRVCKSVSQEASAVLYTKRTAVISILPHQYYLHGRTQPVEQLLRDTEDHSKEKQSTVVLSGGDEPERRPIGHICAHTLVRFQYIRLCLFFNPEFPLPLKYIKFNVAEELKRILEVLRDHSPSKEHTFPGKHTLELIIAINPWPQIEKAETPQEERLRKKILEVGIPAILKAVREKRTLKIGGNLTREGLAKFCEAISGDAI